MAAIAATLCHQSLAAWDARTRHPVSLHVAGEVDRNHPVYRGVSFETEATDESNEDASSPVRRRGRQSAAVGHPPAPGGQATPACSNASRQRSVADG
ncbi:RNAseH domain-containing protein [Streptomyces sp. NBC_01275]|uniref:RNaseH domain-containing protein n=1 Tax=Streptomyces sp. NBC_01275 TaxID=2903807 RepID=UPI002251527A|nr:RNaseH domain-containing protein [Streptomyces sp. NBC_01275]MCX4763927.1 RNAseH domain-containing protein [Streptomyces sp. NBC_01275]